MATSVDICNKALVLLGIQETISSLTQDSAEAKAFNQVYTDLRDWCLGAVNWNFARKSAILTPNKVYTGSPWTAAQPSPPWLAEYLMPTDALRIQYITNLTQDSAVTKFLGEPRRFQVAMDTIASVQTKVILCNETTSIIAIYTAQITDPTMWPWLFERFIVSSIAWTVSPVLTGDKDLTKELNAMMNNYFDIAFQSNLAEGLYFNDTGPEWIQALGVNYPFRRQDGREPQAKDKPNDNRR